MPARSSPRSHAPPRELRPRAVTAADPRRATPSANGLEKPHSRWPTRPGPPRRPKQESSGLPDCSCCLVKRQVRAANPSEFVVSAPLFVSPGEDRGGSLAGAATNRCVRGRHDGDRFFGRGYLHQQGSCPAQSGHNVSMFQEKRETWALGSGGVGTAALRASCVVQPALAKSPEPPANLATIRRSPTSVPKSFRIERLSCGFPKRYPWP